MLEPGAILAGLVAGDDLTADAMEGAVGQIMDGGWTDAQIGAFLTALRLKGETPDELVAAVRALRGRAVTVAADGPLVDTCGTGGDGLGTFNVSTAAAFVVAAAGLRVAKHGNRAASGTVGGADVLEALGARIELEPAEAERALSEVGFCFLFAPLYHPAVRHVATARRELGFRTLFNLTGPLCNPAGATRQLIGLFSSDWLEPVAHALQSLGSEHALVVHGADGSDEISPAARTTVVELRDGRLSRYDIEPEQFGIRRCGIAELAGGDAARNAAIIREVFDGRRGACADAVVLNAGAALYAGGRTETVDDGVRVAREVVEEGAALARLEAFVTFTRRGQA